MTLFRLILIGGLAILGIMLLSQPVQAYEICCCQVIFGQEQCGLVNINPGYSCAEVTGGYEWNGAPGDCPAGGGSGDGASTDDGRISELKFSPNVPIPGLFEGHQPVDGTLLARYIRAFYVYFVWIVGILATVMIMFAGFQWITAAGNASRIENAKSTMNGALLGLVLTLSSFLVLNLINPTLVSFESLSIFKVKNVTIDENREESEKGTPAVPLPARGVDVSTIGNVNRWDSLIASIAAEPEIRLDPYYVKAIMVIESRGNPDAVSPKGACGLLQVMPANANQACLKGEANVEQNLRIGMRLMRSLFTTTCPGSAKYKNGEYATCTPEETSCTNNWHYVIAAYNGGLGANCSSISCPGATWWECSENPGFAETRNYVPTVESMYQVVRQWGGLG